MIPTKLNQQAVCNPSDPVVVTKNGAMRGTFINGVYAFLGIPYAHAERFHMPVPAGRWDGILDAASYGPVCQEAWSPAAEDDFYTPHYYQVMSEDCQNLNIWTTEPGGKELRPVMVWIHGGGYSTGSSVEQYAYDGMNLASFGNVVVVSVNHRLNILGYLDLSHYGEEYRYSGNAGNADLVESLRWIHENISCFGGDPDNVTILGQSGGGQKVNALLQTPSADGLFHKAVVQSGMRQEIRDYTKEEGRHIAELVIENLGLDEGHISDIEKIPYYRLARADRYAMEMLSREFNQDMSWRPVVDMDFYYGSAQRVPVRSAAKKIPMIIGTVLGEQEHNLKVRLSAEGSKNSWDEGRYPLLLRERFGDHTDAVIEGMKKAYPEKKLIDAAFIDRDSRTTHRDYCRKRAAEGCAPVWNYVFALESPYNDGAVAWHNLEIAYEFHNADHMEAAYIPGVSEHVQDQMAGAFVRFAYTGDPNGKVSGLEEAGLPYWPSVTTDNGACMIFDRTSRVGFHHDDDLMAAYPICIPPHRAVPIGELSIGGGPWENL